MLLKNRVNILPLAEPRQQLLVTSRLARCRLEAIKATPIHPK